MEMSDQLVERGAGMTFFRETLGSAGMSWTLAKLLRYSQNFEMANTNLSKLSVSGNVRQLTLLLVAQVHNYQDDKN